ncbi:hypothetical protein BegalDRAFT_1706 [Beggiatoa alba B18LD]|uniref:DUF4340 domain-containing protein n=1 Tax=Beggiatoa alba B18LD TaxID=395493 RepID=I3CG41_9GAMM|nr:DUF4340 domain-containing protein [Beggiatoa alba]EIJ42584.1 hypothetical protein BegalDRAFT_1706 [Beggiatoa alba B18LD]
MNIKGLSILAVLTAITIFFAVQLTQQKHQANSTDNKQASILFPDLMSVINEVSEIDIKTAEQSMTLSRSIDGLWGMKEKSNYPADLTKVRNVLMGISHLKVLEPKTVNSEWYDKIGVEDVTATNAKSTLITLKKPDDSSVASLLVGNQQLAKADNTQQEIFVRKVGDKQSWLVQGSLPIEKAPLSWISKELTNIALQRIQSVEVTQPDGQKIQINKVNANDENYQLATLPEGAHVSQPSMINQLASTLSNLTLDDVIASKELKGDEKTGVTATFTTFDGLSVTLKTVEKDGKHYGQFTVSFNAPAKSEETATTDKTAKESTEAEKDKPDPVESARKEAEKLQQTLTGWAYVLPEYKMERLLKPQSDFVSTEVAQTAVGDAIGEPSTTGTHPLVPAPSLEELMKPTH